MSFVSSIASGSSKVELFLCIESIGWAVAPGDLSQGFAGDVFATADLNGTLATRLGCTVHTGMGLPSTIKQKLHPITGAFTVGGLSVEIVDDGWWLANFTPQRTNDQITLSTGIGYQGTAVVFASGDFTPVEGDVVFVQGREAIKLGAESPSLTFSSCTRGHLGTVRGRRNSLPVDGESYRWRAGAIVYNNRKVWRDLHAELYAHIAGEASAEVVRLWTGKLQRVSYDTAGVRYLLQFNGDFLRDTSRTWTATDIGVTDSFAAWEDALQIDRDDERSRDGIYIETPSSSNNQFGNIRVIDIRTMGQLTSDRPGKYAPMSVYRYRTEIGGTYGARSAWDFVSAGSSPQALDTADDTDVCMEFMAVGGRPFIALKRHAPMGVLDNGMRIQTEVISSAGYGTDVTITAGRNALPQQPTLPANTLARVLLSNWLPQYEFNRYAVDKKVSRNPIDILLCHLMSRDDEYFIADTAAGSTTSVINFTSPGFTANMYAGAALFCVEGTNKGESRVITSNTTSAITVEDPFGGTVAAGAEYQVRNSMYDVLPIGWGVGIPFNQIDVGSFEALRDQYFAEAEVGRFILGTQSSTNIWEMLRKNIMEPYGIHLYFSRSTGKLTAEYLGEAFGDGIVEDYTQITDADIIGEPGAVDAAIDMRVDAIRILTRTLEEKVIGLRYWTSPVSHQTFIEGEIRSEVPTPFDGELVSIDLKLESIDAAESSEERSEIEFVAAFNTIENIAAIVSRAQYIMRAYKAGRQIIPIRFSSAHVATMRVNQILSFTLTQAKNPFTGLRGWSAVIGRVLETRLDFESMTVDATIELIDELDTGLVGPAATVASDNGISRFTVNPTDYVSDKNNDRDYYGFAVGDRIEVRSKTGAVKLAGLVIESFGVNEADTPQGASSHDVNVATSIAAYTYASGDYLCFTTSSGSNTARMGYHAAYASSAGAVTGMATPRRYST